MTREELIRAHLPFVKKLAHKYGGKVPFEDLVQEGMIGIIEAHKRYDSKRGTNFLTYAAYWIKRQMLNSVYKFVKHSDKESTDSYAESEYESEVLDLMEMNQELNLVLTALNSSEFSDRDRDIIKGRFLKDKPLTLKELGNKYNISKERVRQLESGILTKLKGIVL